jgi:hypothetical protein
MKAVRIRKHIESETLHLPELSSLLGKDVEIIVIEDQGEQTGDQDLQPLFDLAGHIDLDYEAIENLRKISII